MIPVIIVGALLHLSAIQQFLVTLGRRTHLVATPPVPSTGPPLQKLAADLRRLRPEARMPRPGVPMAKQKGIVAAYDGVMVSTARALEVPTSLSELPEGIDREAERLRLEHALAAAGLSWHLHQD